MSKKVIKTKYGTVINVEGLTPEQVKKVKSTAEDKGAYGAKGAALADTMRKKNKKKAETPAPTPAPGIPPEDNPETGIDPRTGGFDDPDATLGQMPKVPGATDLAADVKAARDAAYNYSTQYNARDKAQELEDKKQELAQRGIPIDPTEGSLWQKTLQGTDRKYQELDDQARNLAIQQGNQILDTESNVGQRASDQFLKAVLGMSDADLTRYGIDKDFKAKMKAIQAQKEAAARTSGGGSSGGGGQQDTSPIIGGDAP